MNIDGDHSKSVKDIMKAGINTYMSDGTAKALNLSGHRLKTIKPLKLFKIGTFKILAFRTEHDCEDPLGFLIQSGNNKILFATDTYYIKYRFNGLTHILLEANYSKEILDENIKNGSVPAAIRNRIVKSHFEIENVKEFLLANDLSKVEEIYLIHMSSGNADSKAFCEEIRAITGKPVYAV